MKDFVKVFTKHFENHELNLTIPYYGVYRVNKDRVIYPSKINYYC